MQVIFMIHLFASSLMGGIIWFVQVIHYPLFNQIGSAQFVAYEREHVRRTKFLIAPLMLIELGSGLFLILMNHSFNVYLININFILLILIWISTFFIQVPLHNALLDKRDSMSISKLVKSNWVRTLLWTSRLVLLLIIIPFSNDY